MIIKTNLETDSIVEKRFLSEKQLENWSLTCLFIYDLFYCHLLLFVIFIINVSCKYWYFFSFYISLSKVTCKIYRTTVDVTLFSIYTLLVYVMFTWLLFKLINFIFSYCWTQFSSVMWSSILPLLFNNIWKWFCHASRRGESATLALLSWSKTLFLY